MDNMKNRAIGCMIGLVVGDCLGSSIEFSERDDYEPVTGMRGGGPFNLNPGEWTDDTSMALALADTISIKGTVDKTDLMERFCFWRYNGWYSHNGRCFDIGNTTMAAILKYKKLNKYEDAEPLDSYCGNGSIMRLAPVPVRWHNDIEQSRKMAVEQSLTTHSNPLVLKHVLELNDILHDLINGKSYGFPDLKDVDRDLISSSGYVVDTMNAAKWAVENTNNFHDAVLLAANLGDDSDTVAAVAGQIAGAKYGFDSIPKEWVDILAWKNRIMSLTEKLYMEGE